MQRMKTGCERGNALVDLALIFPLFAMLALVGLEFSRSLKYAEGAGSFSREAASQEYRKCIGNYKADVASADDMADLDKCLENVRKGIETFAQKNFPNTEVILSLYRYGEFSPAPANCTGNLGPHQMVRVGMSKTPGAKYGTRFQFRNDSGGALPESATTGTKMSGGFDKQTLCMSRALVVAEVFIPYTPIAGDAAKLFSFNPSEFYSVGIM